MGRPADLGKPRDTYLRVRLGDTDEAALDRIQGDETRSEAVRGLIHAEDRRQRRRK